MVESTCLLILAVVCGTTRTLFTMCTLLVVHAREQKIFFSDYVGCLLRHVWNAVPII